MNMLGNKTRRRENGRFLFGEQGLAGLTGRYGTPLYVFSEKQLKRNVREIQERFMTYHTKISVHHAAKFEFAVANLQIIKSAGGSLEVKSVGELLKALYADFHGSRIVFNGTDKTEDEIEMAIVSGVKSISADSEFELERIVNIATRLKKRANVSIRVMPGGIAPEVIENVVRYTLKNQNWVCLKGYRFHIRPQACDSKSCLGAFKNMLNTTVNIYSKTGYRPELLSIGGEFPIEKIAKELCEELSEEKAGEWTGKDNAGFFKDVELVLEPGRKAVDAAGVFLSGMERQSKPYKAAEAGVVLIRENGQDIAIKPAKKYGYLERGEAEQEGIRNV